MLTPTVEETMPEAPAPDAAPNEHATGEMLTPAVEETPLPTTSAMSSAASPGATPEPEPTQQPRPGEQALPQLLDAAAAINAPDELSPEQQLAIVLELRHALRRQTDDRGRHDIRRLLHALRRRPEATYAAVVEIDDILAADTGSHVAPSAGPTPAEAPTTTYRRPPTDAPTVTVRTRPPLPQQPMGPPSWPAPQSSGPLPAQMGPPPMVPAPQSARGGSAMWLAIAAIVLILVGIAVILFVVLT